MQTKTFQVEGADTTLTIHLATNFWQRFRGLMMRRPLPPATALLIVPCNSIHMCFMRFAIDAVYLDKQGKILKINPDTTVHGLPIKCKLCRQESIVNIDAPEPASKRTSA